VIFPGDAITKRDLAAYYRDVGALFVPGLAGRPLSLVRCPQGRAKQCFFQKHDSGSFGDAVHRFAIADKAGKTEDYLHVDSDAGVLACVQMGTIEFHIWGSRVDAIETPDRMVFDLDPDTSVDFAAVKSGAVLMRDALASMGLASFALLSGGKGIHVVVPLTPAAEWPAVADFASRFARAMAGAHPDRFVATMSKAKRKDRIFIDWLRNQRGATAVAPYSARARAGAPVAAPVSWNELGDIDTAARFSVRDAAVLIDRATTVVAGWGSAAQRLPDL
jgi:bifunctional non-homologous end joining protein LigD